MGNPVEGECYGCYDNLTFQYHGQSPNFNTEIKRYIDGLASNPTIKCRSCYRTVRYERRDGKYTEVVVND